MKLRKIMAVLMAASVMLHSLAGCGGSSSSGSSDRFFRFSASSDSGNSIQNRYLPAVRARST